MWDTWRSLHSQIKQQKMRYSLIQHAQAQIILRWILETTWKLEPYKSKTTVLAKELAHFLKSLHTVLLQLNRRIWSSFLREQSACMQQRKQSKFSKFLLIMRKLAVMISKKVIYWENIVINRKHQKMSIKIASICEGLQKKEIFKLNQDYWS